VSLRSLLDHLALPGEPTQEWTGLAASVPAGVPTTVPVGGLVAAPGAAAAHQPAAAELELVGRAREGDQDAFAALVRLHQRAVYALARRMLRDDEEAVEAAQEVFLAVWQGLKGFRGDARLATWLYRITYNHCLKVAEQRRRDAETRAELARVTAQAARPAVRISQIHAQAALRDLCDTVRVEIANLPPKYRAVLALRHLQDLSYEEMAAVLGMPVGTVKTHLFRARAILRERLADLDRARASGLSRAGDLSAGLRDLIGKRLDGLLKEGES
jgi:RNA polymerase sigma-70 factor (ECF subfamily)